MNLFFVNVWCTCTLQLCRNAIFTTNYNVLFVDYWKSIYKSPQKDGEFGQNCRKWLAIGNVGNTCVLGLWYLPINGPTHFVNIRCFFAVFGHMLVTCTTHQESLLYQWTMTWFECLLVKRSHTYWVVFDRHFSDTCTSEIKVFHALFSSNIWSLPKLVCLKL